MAILETTQPLNLSQREVAVIVAKSIAATGLPVPSKKVRNDHKHIQIDPIVLEVRVTDPKLGVRLQFMTKENFKVDFNISMDTFEAGPAVYLDHLFERLGQMLRNGLKLRRNTQIANKAMYDMLTKDAANG